MFALARLLWCGGPLDDTHPWLGTRQRFAAALSAGGDHPDSSLHGLDRVSPSLVKNFGKRIGYFVAAGGAGILRYATVAAPNVITPSKRSQIRRSRADGLHRHTHTHPAQSGAE